jgi:RNA polymerase sigma-70 factor (ECF subfamily)
MHAMRLALRTRRSASKVTEIAAPTRETIMRAQQLDEAALSEVYEWLYPQIRAYAYSRTRDRERSNDLVGAAMLKIVENLPSCDFGGANSNRRLKSWSFRITRNLVIDEQRRRGRFLDADMATMISDAPLPHVLAQRALDRDRVSKALSSLTSLQRKVIVLKYLHDMDNASVGHVVGRSIAAVKSLQHRGLQGLRRQLSATEPAKAPAQSESLA